jgi:type VI protein secretion system component VasF
MSTEITTAASAAPAGSLAAVGTAAKAFVLAHPIGLSIAGGVLLGVGAYWGMQRLLSKDESDTQTDDAAAATAA